ncbi:MAG: hypothetical protein K0Q73_6078 [Paenibacillus sp.]|jgi:hypothetical protein|nr:hypothetical protein [Paenibacillus sp.]
MNPQAKVSFQVPHRFVTQKQPVFDDVSAERGPSPTHARQSAFPNPLRDFPKNLPLFIMRIFARRKRIEGLSPYSQTLDMLPIW